MAKRAKRVKPPAKRLPASLDRAIKALDPPFHAGPGFVPCTTLRKAVRSTEPGLSELAVECIHRAAERPPEERVACLVPLVVRLIEAEDDGLRWDARRTCRERMTPELAPAIPALARIAQGPKLAGALGEALDSQERTDAVLALEALDRLGVDIAAALPTLEAVAAERPGEARAAAASFISGYFRRIGREPDLAVKFPGGGSFTDTHVSHRPFFGPAGPLPAGPSPYGTGPCGLCGKDIPCTYRFNDSGNSWRHVDEEAYCAACGKYTIWYTRD